MTTSAFTVSHDGPGGCPVLHGFNPLGDTEVNDPQEWTALARDQAPVFFIPGANIFVATRHDDVKRVLADHEAFAPITPPARFPPAAREILPDGFVFQRGNMMGTTSPPEHTRLRKLAQRAFTRSAAQARADEIRTLCHSLVDDFAADGHAELVSQYTSRYPIRVMALVLGVDLEDAPKLYQWAIDNLRLFGDPAIPEDELLDICRNQAEWEQWTLDLIQQRRREALGDNDVVSALLAARDEDGGPRLSDIEIFGIIVQMIGAGADTASATTAQMMLRMLTDPPLLDRVRREPELIDVFIEEELRHDFVGRMTFRTVAADDVELGGVSLPRGSVIGAHIWAANHDARVCPNPETFDLDRPRVGDHLGWGKGTHFCLGAPLARVEIAISVQTLLERLPNLRVADGAHLDRVPALFLPSPYGGLEVTWDIG